MAAASPIPWSIAQMANLLLDVRIGELRSTAQTIAFIGTWNKFRRVTRWVEGIASENEGYMALQFDLTSAICVVSRKVESAAELEDEEEEEKSVGRKRACDERQTTQEKGDHQRQAAGKIWDELKK